MVKANRLQKAAASGRTLIVGSVTTHEGLKRAALAQNTDCDVIEVRLDLMPRRLLMNLSDLRKCLVAVRLPVLVTLRSALEGGKCGWSVGWKLEFLDKILNQTDAIDLELATAEKCMDHVAHFSAQGKTVILSYHDFVKMPPPGFIDKKIRLMFGRGADYAKVSVTLKTQRQMDKLVELMKEQKKPVALMGMGPLATQSRIALCRAGSRLAYGYFDQPAAPGQISCKKLKELLE